MKKIYCVLILLFIFLVDFNVYALSKKEVKFSKCVDGDTARVILNKEEIKVRFLAIDTPESVHPTKEEEQFGKETSEYTCEKLKNAKTILIEYDPESDKTDKYDRHLVWIYVDDILLQKDLIEKGYAKVAYLYGDYLYTDELKEVEEVAKKSGVGIWSDSTNQEKTEENEEYNIIEKIIDQICEILEKLIEILTDFINDMV